MRQIGDKDEDTAAVAMATGGAGGMACWSLLVSFISNSFLLLHLVISQLSVFFCMRST